MLLLNINGNESKLHNCPKTIAMEICILIFRFLNNKSLFFFL